MNPRPDRATADAAVLNTAQVPVRIRLGARKYTHTNRKENPMPARIQRRRTKGWRKPENAVYVGRGSGWGNPFVVGENGLWMADATHPLTTAREPGEYEHGIRVERCTDRATAAAWYRAYIEAYDLLLQNALRDLEGRDLMCWCPLDEPCHADVLLEIANGGPA
jgi:hypothetical protein